MSGTGLQVQQLSLSIPGGVVTCTDPNGFYAHPTDCQKYYQCANGIPYEYTCHPGTLWNTNINSCDWEANVQCNSGLISTFFAYFSQSYLVSEKYQKSYLFDFPQTSSLIHHSEGHYVNIKIERNT